MTLAVIVFLTQSLRFLELVIDAGASGSAFWILTLLTMPRFLEIILPIALMAATMFVYNRMNADSELVVLRGAGFSPLRLARPAIALSLVTALFLLFITIWLSPLSLVNMQSLKAEIKAQYSTLLFREGVFNPVGKNVTVFVRERMSSGELRGLMIHDSRPENKYPVTILARRGVLAMTGGEQQVVVYEGSRQELNPRTGALNRLDFDSYTINLPDSSSPASPRWREPEERSFAELLNPAVSDIKNAKNRRDFRIEANRRILSPFLAPVLTLMSLALLLAGPADRRGQGKRIAAAIVIAALIEGLYISAFDLARQTNTGLVMMYMMLIAPAGMAVFMLNGRSDTLKRRLTNLRRNRETPA